MPGIASTDSRRLPLPRRHRRRRTPPPRRLDCIDGERPAGDAGWDASLWPLFSSDAPTESWFPTWDTTPTMTAEREWSARWAHRASLINSVGSMVGVVSSMFIDQVQERTGTRRSAAGGGRKVRCRSRRVRVVVVYFHASCGRALKECTGRRLNRSCLVRRPRWAGKSAHGLSGLAHAAIERRCSMGRPSWSPPVSIDLQRVGLPRLVLSRGRFDRR